MLILKPVLIGGHQSKLILTEYSKKIYDKMQNMYGQTGFANPWIGYLAMINHEIVGSCGFKGKPCDNKTVEIAYTTRPGMEGKGFATEMCRLLKDVAYYNDHTVVLKAETLTTNVASHKILYKNGFELLDCTVTDPTHGEILQWQYKHSR